MVLIDTSAWVQFLRSPDSSQGREVDALLERDNVVLTGVVLAGLLQGVRQGRQRTALARRFRALPYEDPDKEGWVKVGEIAAELRAQGRTMALSDLVIAVVALQGNHELFTLDADFDRVPGLRLHELNPA